jgi:phage terminase large subunit-like protein
VELIERCRIPPRACLGEGDHPEDGGGAPAFSRTLVAVDPPSGDGTCGIVACAREGDGGQAVGHVLADHSVSGRSPEGWAAAVAAAAAAHGTDEIVAEANQGGNMVKAVLHTADPGLRVKLVNASTGKAARAEPIAHLFEAGRAKLRGRMPALEAQLLGLIAGGGYEGPGPSPDRADAMVWGLSELMLGQRRGPRVWVG